MEKISTWQSVIDVIIFDTSNNNYIKSLCISLLQEVEKRELTKPVIRKFNTYLLNYPPPNALLRACHDYDIQLKF